MANYDKYKVGRDSDAERTQKPKKRVKIHEEGTPMYRAYGVTKKVYPAAERVKKVLLAIATTFIIGLPVGVLLFGLFLIAVATEFGKVLFATVVLVPLLFVPVRVLLKRRKFIKRLKKLCREKHFELKFRRNFFASFFYKKGTYDFTVKTSNKTWICKYLTSPTRDRLIQFDTPERITFFKGLTPNRIKEAYGIPSPRRREKFFSFSLPDGFSDKCELAVIMNPAPKMTDLKLPDGRTEATGTGAKIFGYKIFTGSGFISTISRSDIEY
ncbi:MAG: hypothetical protein J6Q78_01960 [Clostridia bacterium]|nr:hypothetical protein [Clostridia bacterium]